MYYPDDDTLVIERKDVIGKATSDDEDIDSSKTSLTRKYKGYWSGKLNPDLLLCKIFYFTFYGSYGCLFPLIAVYFKQLGLSATQIGVLVGIRPFVEFCAAPMWGAVADSWRSAKAILLFSLLSWLVFTEAVTLIQPAPSTCVLLNTSIPADATLIIVGDPQKTGIRERESDDDAAQAVNNWVSPEVARRKRSTMLSRNSRNDAIKREYRVPNDTKSTIPSKQTNSDSRKPTIHQGKVTVIKYRDEDTNLTFIYLLLLMILGEFFSSPTITLADSATLGYLGHQRMELYGRQRMFGSLAWGIFMFVEGIILDRTKTTKVECDGEVTMEEENYLVCFGTYAVLITCAFFVATQFQFKYSSLSDAIWQMESRSQPSKDAGELIELENVRKTIGKYQDDPKKSPQKDSDITDEKEDGARYMKVLGLYASVKQGTVLFVVWLAGFGFGFLFTFLFWHLKELGAPPTLFGVASIINHLSEVMGYFFSSWFIRKLGHIPVLCLGLMCYAVRLIVVSYLVNPWGVLAVETLQGVTHALVWAASTSFIGMNTSQENRSTAQGILQGVYHGLGRGCGAIFGGIIINAYGSTLTFRALGATYVVFAAIFAFIQYMEKDTDERREQEEEENYVKDDDPEHIEETVLLSQGEGATNMQAEERDMGAAVIGEDSG